MPQMRRIKFGSDQLNRAKVEKRDGQPTDRKAFILIGFWVAIRNKKYLFKKIEYRKK